MIANAITTSECRKTSLNKIFILFVISSYDLLYYILNLNNSILFWHANNQVQFAHVYIGKHNLITNHIVKGPPWYISPVGRFKWTTTLYTKESNLWWRKWLWRWLRWVCLWNTKECNTFSRLSWIKWTNKRKISTWSASQCGLQKS